MASLVGVAPRRRVAGLPILTGPMLAAAARGLGLVVAAVALGVILLEATDDSGAPPPAVSAVAGADETTTTTTEGTGIDTGQRPATQVNVLVLNAARIEGAATEIAEKLQSLGHPTLPPGNAPTQPETIVYYKPGFEREAAALAPEVSDTALTEPLPDPSPFAGTEQADVVVVIGTSFAGTGGSTTPPG